MKRLLQTLAFCIATTSSQADENFELQNRSSFSIEDSERNPFLPIGWAKPQGGQKSAPVVTAALNPEDFLLSSILLGREPMAVINGKVYTEGDVAPVEVGSRQVTVEVRAIHDGEVVLGYLDRNITVPLKRR
jgi:hypothetical protein